MSDSKPTELVSTFFSVTADAFSHDRQIEVHINPNNRDIIALKVAGFRISTDRDNWARIFNEFARVCTADILEVNVPTRTFRIAFDDENRTAVAVAE
jgi:hypothetical protein